MLNVEEMPVVSVPVVATDAWMREKAPVPPPAPAPPRFMSEDEDEEAGEGESELVAAATRPSQVEMSEELAFAPLPRDYASDFGNSMRTPAITEDHVSQPAVSPLSTAATEEERDLDVPTFMRRMKF